MATQLADGVWFLDLGLLPPLATNAYLVDDTDGSIFGDGQTADGGTTAADESGVTLVDAGLFWNLKPIRSELADAGYSVGDVDRVLLTHYDLDHTMGLNRIEDELRAPVYLGGADVRLLDGSDDPGLLHHKGLFHRLVRHVAPLPDDVTVESVADGDRIGRFTAYHTPGHNPGHTVYVHDEGAAFLGDLVWEDEGELTPPFWLDSYDMDRIGESIRRFSDRSGEFELACMGHGTPLIRGGADAVRRLAETL
ncbi:MBL fold metallo-hydrolase [Halorientalis salina]|uniref:MBL fold metallo-hydrolase n=1 Tax=Halorientalis salina TaxID=2932266 RepID=UPI0010AC2727|nr:MBL fold metallo-hydrolase [Halorientalis salina]